MSMRRKLLVLALTATFVVPLAIDLAAETQRGKKRPWASASSLGGTDRYLTHVNTDKPIYRSGETVRVRGVILHAHTHAPLLGRPFTGQLQILGPKGEPITTSHIPGQDSVLASGWVVPPGAAGGEYLAKITFPNTGFPPAQRKFEVRAYRPPRLNGQIVFVRDGYGPGDRVAASLHCERAEGGLPKGAKVTVTAVVDGTEIYRNATTVDEAGNAAASFELPKKIARGDGTLAFTIQDGGVVETTSKTIPILVDNLELAFFPEGGDLVAGLMNRVYVQARTPVGKPADIQGVVLNEEGNEVAKVRTTHEGRGHFTFRPDDSHRYTLKITHPSGLELPRPLPVAKKTGAVLSSVDDVTGPGEPVRIRIGARGHRHMRLTLAHKDRVLSTSSVPAGRRTIGRAIRIPAEVSGVLTATLWSNKGEPLAERLIFRAPRRRLRVEVTPNAPRFTPGSEVELTVRTTVDGKGVPAWVGLAVTDESVLEMIDKREQAPRLPVMVFLENDVKDLADAHVYLDPQHPKGRHAVDLLLGTQGWRRFALVDPNAFVNKHGDSARRVLAKVVPPPPPLAVSDGHLDMVPMAAQRKASRKRAPSRAPRAPRAARKPAPPQANAAMRPPAPPRGARKPGAAGGARARRMAKRERAAEVSHSSPLVYARIYAHPVRPNRKPGKRVDFTETVYWNAGVQTNADGVAQVRFALSDSVTTFRAMADGFDSQGALGSGATAVISVEPFYLEPKMPLHATAGDIIELPVSIVNSTQATLRDGSLEVTVPDGITAQAPKNPLNVAPNSRNRHLIALEVKEGLGPAKVTVKAQGGNYRDQVTRRFNIEPAGFPAQVASGGQLNPGQTVKVDVHIPPTAIPGSVTSDVQVYPAPLGNLTASLEGLLREPHGCFEQTSSTNYPLVMAQQYFTTHGGVDPQLIARSRRLLAKGYQRLVGFECKEDGYEWFGQDPGHEALSAYGLMEFVDMSKVMQVDTQMVDRTRAFLLGKRDGKGGFSHERRALHTWLVQPDIHNGYITWALTESGVAGIEKEIASFKQTASESDDSYVVALGANVALNDEDERTAGKLMKRLVEKQTKDGWVDGSTTSIVGSRGEALKIETTALAILAWLRDRNFAGSVEQGIRYLSQSAKGGRYGSTQSTILALRAILAYDRARATSKKPGRVRLFLDGEPVGKAISISPRAQSAIEFADLSAKLTPGRHTLALELQGGSPMPYAMTVRYHAKTPSSSEDCKLSMSAELRAPQIDEGATTQIQVTVKNRSDEVLPMPVAVVGIPGGLEVRHDQLKELKKANRISAYEVRGRDVVLYWRELGPKQELRLPLSVVAAIPGTYTGPASRVYQYYVDEHRQWVDGTKVRIKPKGR